jgi:hypothetical protein
VDDNCNGLVDEDYAPTPTTCGIGACEAAGELVCQDGQLSDTCNQGQPTAELCDNIDNDCDGTTDEALTQICYTGPTGTEGVGICQGGTQTCSAGAWGSCAGQVTPQTEINCNGIDENCNGMADDCPINDQDGDGVLDNVDQCLTIKGPASRFGCPYLINNYLEMKVTDMADAGLCSDGKKNCKFALANVP